MVTRHLFGRIIFMRLVRNCIAMNYLQLSNFGIQLEDVHTQIGEFYCWYALLTSVFSTWKTKYLQPECHLARLVYSSSSAWMKIWFSPNDKDVLEYRRVPSKTLYTIRVGRGEISLDMSQSLWYCASKRAGNSKALAIGIYQNAELVTEKAPCGNDWSSLLHVSQMIGSELRF